MKKIISLSLGLVLVLGLLSGCAKEMGKKAGDTVQKAGDTVQKAGDMAQKTVQAVENTGEAVLSDTQQEQNNTDTMQQTQKKSQPSQQEKDSFIGEERAKEIALQKAGITADGVRFDKVELDRDNGVWQYEVEFRKGNTEYDADIKADDGTVLSWDVDIDD